MVHNEIQNRKLLTYVKMLGKDIRTSIMLCMVEEVLIRTRVFTRYIFNIIS